ncbi:amidohydrolase family protein [Alkalisalibacterium limincola]|nr:amidohydrolase family protein [Alkalisalibacterium limincola]
MRLIIFLIFLLFPISILLMPWPAQGQPNHGPLALDNVQVIDAEHERVSAPRCVRIETGRLARIDEAGSAECHEQAQVLDLQGRYLMPGLIDMHAHLDLGPMEILQEDGQVLGQALPDDEIAEHNARRLVAFGVTTVRNPGGDLESAARYKARRAAGELVGPELFNAGLIINNAKLRGLAVAAETPDDVRRLVAEQVAGGADWIKFYTGLSPEMLQAGIDEARAHGRPSVAHLEDIAWTDALAMGLDGIVHLMPLSPDLRTTEQRDAWQATSRGATYSFFEWWEHFDVDGPHAEQLIAAFEQHRPVFDATVMVFHAAFVQDSDDTYKEDSRRYAHPRLLANWNEWFTFGLGWEAEDFERARAVWPKVQRMAARLHATDARMTIGTDMGNPWVAPGISVHREMELLADAGVPAPRLLLAATSNAADALGIGEQTGRIASGYQADLLVLDANPLLDISNTKQIHAVVLDGQLLTTEALNQLKGE